jgi:DNA invertase Pin-like site-specific DNA recombinase
MAKEPVLKRMNVNMDANLHQAFKVAAVAQGKDMSTVLIELVQQYVEKYYPKGLPAAAEERSSLMKRAALYMRVSTVDQHPETQLHDLRGLAAQRGFDIVNEYTDKISGAKAKRPGLDQLLANARRGKFDVVMVWAFDRMARSVRHFLEVLDELTHLHIEFISFRENIDTGGPLGRAMIVIVSAIAELERNLIIERVRAGMRRARLEGRHIGRQPLDLDRTAIVEDRRRGLSLSQVAGLHRISRTTVVRVLRQQQTELHGNG